MLYKCNDTESGTCAGTTVEHVPSIAIFMSVSESTLTFVPVLAVIQSRKERVIECERRKVVLTYKEEERFHHDVR